MALTRHEIASLDPAASTPKVPASTENAFASTSSNQIVPDVEAVEAVEANPHTIRGRTQPQPSAMRPEESLDMPPSRIC